MWIQGLRSRGPASSSRTEWRPDSLSRAATAQPADPAPATMKSYSPPSSAIPRSPPARDARRRKRVPAGKCCQWRGVGVGTKRWRYRRRASARLRALSQGAVTMANSFPRNAILFRLSRSSWGAVNGAAMEQDRAAGGPGIRRVRRRETVGEIGAPLQLPGGVGGVDPAAFDFQRRREEAPVGGAQEEHEIAPPARDPVRLERRVGVHDRAIRRHAVQRHVAPVPGAGVAAVLRAHPGADAFEAFVHSGVSSPASASRFCNVAERL